MILHVVRAILLVGKYTDQLLWSDDGPTMRLVPFGRFCTVNQPRSHKFQGPLILLSYTKRDSTLINNKGIRNFRLGDLSLNIEEIGG